MPACVASFPVIEDPRTGGNKLHHCGEVLFMAVSTMLCGMNCFSDIEDFCDLQADWLRKWIRMPNGVLRAQTFANIFAIIDPDLFDRCLFTLASDLFPKQAVASLVGIGGVGGALAALAVIHGQVPRLEPADHGAVPDGKTINTALIQSAIDAAAEPGFYASAALFVKLKVRLHLGGGVVIQAAPVESFYPELPTRLGGGSMATASIGGGSSGEPTAPAG